MNMNVEEVVRSRFQSLARAAESLDHDAYFEHFDTQLFTALNADGTVTHTFESFRSDYLEGVPGPRSLQAARVQECQSRHNRLRQCHFGQRIRRHRSTTGWFGR